MLRIGKTFFTHSSTAAPTAAGCMDLHCLLSNSAWAFEVSWLLVQESTAGNSLLLRSQNFQASRDLLNRSEELCYPRTLSTPRTGWARASESCGCPRGPDHRASSEHVSDTGVEVGVLSGGAMSFQRPWYGPDILQTKSHQ